MTTCSNTDSFRLEADFDYIADDYGVFSNPDGCYAESDSNPAASDEVVDRFYLDGDGLSNYVYYFRTLQLSDFDDLVVDDDSDDVEVWTIATYVAGYVTRCRDYNLTDYATSHPAEVQYWECEDDDGDWVYDAAISTICGCDTPAPTPAATPATTPAPATPDPTAAPTTPLPAAPSAPSSTAASSNSVPAATPGPTPDGLTPAPRTLTDTSSPTRAPEVPSTPPPVGTASDEAPAGEVAGGVVGGVVVVVAVVLAALFKTGRLKIKRTGNQRKPSHDDVAGSSGSTGNTPPAASEAPVHHQYPVAYQYPEAIE